MKSWAVDIYQSRSYWSLKHQQEADAINSYSSRCGYMTAEELDADFTVQLKRHLECFYVLMYR